VPLRYTFLSSLLFFAHLHLIMDRVAALRLPAIYDFPGSNSRLSSTINLKTAKAVGISAAAAFTRRQGDRIIGLQMSLIGPFTTGCLFRADRR
jgi:hypothetical protein